MSEPAVFSENGRPPHILYVEDDMLSRKVMEVLFKSVLSLPDITLFENSENFMERLDGLSAIPDLVLLDVQMRPHDGYEVLKMLRSDSRFEKTAVIAMTANVMFHDIQQLKQAGFSGLIGKPVMKEVFPDLMKKILAGEPVWFVP